MQAVQMERLKVTFSYLAEQEDHCELVPATTISEGTLQDGFVWSSSKLAISIKVRNFTPTCPVEKGTRDALDIILCDICTFLHLHSSTFSVKIFKPLINNLFTSDLNKNVQLSQHLIELLCSIVLGSVQSKLGETSEIQCISRGSPGDEAGFKFLVKTGSVSSEIPAKWKILNIGGDNESSKSQLNNQSIQQAIAEFPKEIDQAYLFILFEVKLSELRGNCCRQVSSDTLNTSNASRIKLMRVGSELQLKIDILDISSGETYRYCDELKSHNPTELLLGRKYFQRDEIITAAINGYISSEFTGTLDCICIPSTSSVWYYNQHFRQEHITQTELTKELCQLAAYGNFSELLTQSAAAIDDPCKLYLNRTPLLCASAAATFRPFGTGTEDHTKCAKVLILCGANISATDAKGASVLHCAVNSSNNSLLEFLLNIKGVDCNWETDDGWTPLMIATNSNNKIAAELLLNAGANKKKMNKAGKTAMDICATVMTALNDPGDKAPPSTCSLSFSISNLSFNFARDQQIAALFAENAAILSYSSNEVKSLAFEILAAISDIQLKVFACISASRAAAEQKNFEFIFEVFMHLLHGNETTLMEKEKLMTAVVHTIALTASDSMQKDIEESRKPTVVYAERKITEEWDKDQDVRRQGCDKILHEEEKKKKEEEEKMKNEEEAEKRRQLQDAQNYVSQPHSGAPQHALDKLNNSRSELEKILKPPEKQWIKNLSNDEAEKLSENLKAMIANLREL